MPSPFSFESYALTYYIHFYSPLTRVTAITDKRTHETHFNFVPPKLTRSMNSVYWQPAESPPVPRFTVTSGWNCFLPYLSGSDSSRATALHLPAQVRCSPTAAAPPHCAQALHTQAMESKVDRNNPVLQILWTCALITDCCFWSYRCGQRGRQLQLLHLLPLVQVPHPPAEGTARGLK